MRTTRGHETLPVGEVREMGEVRCGVAATEAIGTTHRTVGKQLATCCTDNRDGDRTNQTAQQYNGHNVTTGQHGKPADNPTAVEPCQECPRTAPRIGPDAGACDGKRHNTQQQQSQKENATLACLAVGSSRHAATMREQYRATFFTDEFSVLRTVR